jgi:hypothetical protein
MFGRTQPVKNGSAVYTTEPGDDGAGDAAVGDLHLRRSCQEFVNALRACAAFNVDPSVVSVTEPTIDQRYCEEVAYEKMEHALQEVRSSRAVCSADLLAKFEALFALEDWFGKEDFRVTGFTYDLAVESYRYLVTGQAGESKSCPKLGNGSSSKGQESRSGFPRLLRLAGEPRTRTPSRTRRSQS